MPSIGWYAPLMLVMLRIIQGFAVGGEWGGAALLAVESAPAGKKAFYSSGVQVGYGVALVLATGIMLVLSKSLEQRRRSCPGAGGCPSCSASCWSASRCGSG